MTAYGKSVNYFVGRSIRWDHRRPGTSSTTDRHSQTTKNTVDTVACPCKDVRLSALRLVHLTTAPHHEHALTTPSTSAPSLDSQHVDDYLVYTCVLCLTMY